MYNRSQSTASRSSEAGEEIRARDLLPANRKMRPFRYRFATAFRNANFKFFGANSLRRSPHKTVAFYRASRTEPNDSERISPTRNRELETRNRAAQKTGHFRTKRRGGVRKSTQNPPKK